MLDIVYYPDPILRNMSEEITEISDEVKEFVAEMFDTMYKNDGIGLAAPQVGKNIRLFVIDVPGEVGDESIKMVFINPKFLSKSKEKAKAEEGCLSLPEISANVSRPVSVKIQAIGIDGKEFVLEAEGLLARCLQHEADHLDGIVFTDKTSLAGKLSVKSGLRRLEEEYMNRMSKKDSE